MAKRKPKSPEAPAQPVPAPLVVTASSGKWTERQREIIRDAELLVAYLAKLGRTFDHVCISEADAAELRRRHRERPDPKKEGFADLLRDFDKRPMCLGYQGAAVRLLTPDRVWRDETETPGLVGRK